MIRKEICVQVLRVNHEEKVSISYFFDFFFLFFELNQETRASASAAYKSNSCHLHGIYKEYYLTKTTFW